MPASLTSDVSEVVLLVDTDAEVSEPAAVATNGERVQATRCLTGDVQSGPSRGPGVAAPVGGVAVDAGARAAQGEGEIWYNPIPEDEDVVPVVRRPGGSKVQWCVELPCPTEAETSDCPKKPIPAVTPGGTDTVPEPPPIRPRTESSPPTHRPPPVQPTAVSWGNIQPGASLQRPKLSDGAAEPQPDGSSPKAGSRKVCGAQRSLSERVKSPGTVRKLSLRMKRLPELRRRLSLRGTARGGGRQEGGGGGGQPPPAAPAPPAADHNVICRYHLDSSVKARGGGSKKQRGLRSMTRQGYLSDGDSPELVAKGEKPGGWSRLDTGAFRPYPGSEQPRCPQHLSGLIHLRLLGIEGLRSPRAAPGHVFCAVQVDSVSKARTALLACRQPFLSLDHSFNIGLERSRTLTLLVYAWEPGSCRNRLCCHGSALLPPLFRGARSHQLALQMEPRGVFYLKVSLVETWEVPAGGGDETQEPRVFRVDISELVERERSAVSVPLLIQKCVSEIERRGLKAVGLYRLCGSAAVKKELRDTFERDSAAVNLSEETYPDINVITGILKDYLRELPSPLITRTLYDVVLEATTSWPLKMTNGVPDASLCSVNAVGLLDCLPPAEKATLTLLLDHLSLVASLQESNKMTCQNLAVCFGPVLLGQKQESSQHGSSTFSHSKELASALDFKRHIEVLHYLLQLWPSERSKDKRDGLEQQRAGECPRARPQAPAAEEVVCRNRVGRSTSSSRYRHAGDWSSCGRNYLRPAGGQEVDQGPALGTNVLGSQQPADKQDGGRCRTDGQDGRQHHAEGQDGRQLDADTQDGRPPQHADTQDGSQCHTDKQDGRLQQGDKQDGRQQHMDEKDGGQQHMEGQDGCLLHGDKQDGGQHHVDRLDGGSIPSNRQDGGSNPTSGRNCDLLPVNGQGDSLFPGAGQDGNSFSDDDELDFESCFSGRTKEFDSLIADIERELAKKIIFL
ncbi:rho GTPase-activating protein SYDE2-like [Amblyraja radiata]|uniref:rho GTPase-activating protein SYDE2-like n=1 Tax=Amblyraja radiata TaxID=386614 RepID=UPI001402F09D|nr:rho GTPase-activating protein SYDE2-like [Amblyraja radiata]